MPKMWNLCKDVQRRGYAPRHNFFCAEFQKKKKNYRHVAFFIAPNSRTNIFFILFYKKMGNDPDATRRIFFAPNSKFVKNWGGMTFNDANAPRRIFFGAEFELRGGGGDDVQCCECATPHLFWYRIWIEMTFNDDNMPRRIFFCAKCQEICQK